MKIRLDDIPSLRVTVMGLGLHGGGLASALFSIELAHPFIGPTQLAVFADAGNIWETHDAFDIGDLRYGAGFGLRFVTPIGPIRIDVGYKIDKKSGERPRELHFGVGAAF